MASSGIDYAVFNKDIIAEFRANKGVVVACSRAV
jgi:hypothetical protein